MFKNRFLLVIGMLSLLLVTMAVSNPRSNSSFAADTARWEAMGEYYANQADAEHKAAPPYIMDSASRSYIAWAEAADSERTVVDSATRSYTSWARALDAVDSATRSYIAWAQYLLTEPAK